MILYPSCRQVASVAAAVPVILFAPQKGIRIETDPKATQERAHAQDDESVIETLITKLEVIFLTHIALI